MKHEITIDTKGINYRGYDFRSNPDGLGYIVYSNSRGRKILSELKSAIECIEYIDELLEPKKTEVVFTDEGFEYKDYRVVVDYAAHNFDVRAIRGVVKTCTSQKEAIEWIDNKVSS